MSKDTLTEMVYCNVDCDPHHGRCTGHEVTVEKNRTSDMVAVEVDGKRTLFDDKIFAEIVRLWSSDE